MIVHLEYQKRFIEWVIEIRPVEAFQDEAELVSQEFLAEFQRVEGQRICGVYRVLIGPEGRLDHEWVAEVL